MAPSAGSKRLSVVAAAFVLLLAVDYSLAQGQVLQHFPTATLLRGEAYNAAQAYRAERAAPDVVLLGSSLMTAPVMQSEASYVQEPIPRFSHRRISVFEHLLSCQLGGQPTVFCLAIAGEMVSDASLIVRHLFNARQYPRVIVWGVAPRDFQDNLMPGIDSSETFQVLSSLDDLPELWQSCNLSDDRRANDILGRISALFRYRNDIRVYLTLRAKKFLETVFPFVVFDKYGETLELKPRKRGQFPEEAKGVPRAFPGKPLDHLSAEKTRNEYMRRYNPVSAEQINAQSKYFAGLLASCKLRGIAVLVVNMPLSRSNKSLMPAGFYDNYLQRLTALCKQNHAQLFDLNTPAWDEEGNFVDTVHLTPEKSPEFLKVLSERIARSSIAQALKSAAVAEVGLGRDHANDLKRRLPHPD